MLPNTILSIVIPTYNRADFLDLSLQIHIPILQEYNIQVFISDNASTDSTSEIVYKWQQIYPFLYYHRNETNLGADQNIERALKKPETAYIWLFGDTYKLPHNGIEHILRLVSTMPKKFDAIIVDASQRAANISSQNYIDKNALLSDLGWHMSCLSTLIYNANLIKAANFKRYYATRFLQTGILFEYISDKTFCVSWENQVSVEMIQHPSIIKNGWYDGPMLFEILCYDWSNFIFSLPASYHLNVKLKSSMDHGLKSGMFTLKNLLILKEKNIFTFSIYKKYSDLFFLTIKTPKIILFLLAVFPLRIYRLLITFWRLRKLFRPSQKQ